MGVFRWFLSGTDPRSDLSGLNWPVFVFFPPLSESLKDLSVKDNVLLLPLELQLYCKCI